MTTIDMPAPGTAYPLGGDAPDVCALRAHERIRGHSEISNDATYWALYSLVRAS